MYMNRNFYYCKSKVIQNIKFIKNFKKFDNWQEDSLCKNCILISENELRYYFKNRHRKDNNDSCKIK